MSVSNRNFGIHAGVTQAHEKCTMKKKEKKRNKRLLCKNFLMTGRILYDCIRSPTRPISMNFRSTILHTLKVRTICLVNG